MIKANYTRDETDAFQRDVAKVGKLAAELRDGFAEMYKRRAPSAEDAQTFITLVELIFAGQKFNKGWYGYNLKDPALENPTVNQPFSTSAEPNYDPETGEILDES